MTDTYFDNLEFDPAATKDIESGSRVEGVKLPFDVLFANWINGQPIAAANVDSGVKHFGGWGIQEDSIGAAPHIPDKFVYEQFVSKDGKSYQDYCARNLAVAIICRRFRWYAGDRMQPDNVTGNPQFLAMSAIYNKEKKLFEPFAPIILSLKGHAGMEMDSCIKEWSSATMDLRASIAKNLPANFFYMTVGTFGTERVTKPVKAGNTITPPRLFKPAALDADFLKVSFVGKETMDTMIEMKRLAAEWLEAWKDQKPKDKGNAAPAAAKPQQPSAADIPF